MQGELIDSFAARHIGPSEDDQRAMLATLGYASLDERQIARGIQTLGALVESELEKKQRGARRFESGRVALV